MRDGEYASRLGGKWARDTSLMSGVEAFKQGQRDREQDWPDLSERWGFVGPDALAYRRGYAAPRTS